jgi:hypothetical protein
VGRFGFAGMKMGMDRANWAEAQTKARGRSVNARAARRQAREPSAQAGPRTYGSSVRGLWPNAKLSFARLGSEHVVDRVGEVVDPRHWHDDNVAMALTVFGDAKESAAAIFAQIDRKKLSLDLQLS